jgi:hypothetical protein
MGGFAGSAFTAVTTAVATTVSANRIERTAGSLTWNGIPHAARISYLRNRIKSNEQIYADDLNDIATLINNMNGHYHTYLDAYSLKTFGNTGASSPLENKNTNSIDSVTTAPTDTAANTSITATRHNELRTAINNLRVHSHGINDRTAI